MRSTPGSRRAAIRAACSRPASSSCGRCRPTPTNTVERIVDIRVDDHENPFKELRRLLNMTTGVPNRLTDASAKLAHEGKFAEAIAEQQKALDINPRAEQLMYAMAQRYAQAGDAAQRDEVARHGDQPPAEAVEAARDRGPAVRQAARDGGVQEARAVSRTRRFLTRQDHKKARKSVRGVLILRRPADHLTLGRRCFPRFAILTSLAAAVLLLSPADAWAYIY